LCERGNLPELVFSGSERTRSGWPVKQIIQGHMIIKPVIKAKVTGLDRSMAWVSGIIPALWISQKFA